MCEANVYINRAGQEELLMESVDRIVPGEDHTIFLENIFGERRVVKARIREMELVHHRIVLEEISEETIQPHLELWLEPDTQHGHFHPGEEVRLELYKGYNMVANKESGFGELQAFLVKDGLSRELALHDHDGVIEISVLEPVDGLVQIYVQEKGEQDCYALALVEVGHHHHHTMQPAGLPLEIVPSDYSHARLGENYEIQVLKAGQPLAGAVVK